MVKGTYLTMKASAYESQYTGGYVDESYRPTKHDLVMEYYAEPIKGLSLRRLCDFIAGESSIGTWTTISTMNPRIAKHLKPHVYSVNKKTGIIKVAYPDELFEWGNMPGILSSIAGNIFGMKAIRHLRLQDIHFPKSIIQSYRGPEGGIVGIRKLTRTKGRPLVGTIVKPKVGLTAEQHARVAYEAWMGGLDIVKDDENLVSLRFNNFDQRMKLTLKMRDKAEQETGEKKIYLANVTSETKEMLRRAALVDHLGGEFLMVDILTAGWAAVQTLREFGHDRKKFLHGHRAMHGAFTRDPHHGISMLAIAKVARLIGIDTLHTGTAAIGKMVGARDEELAIEHEVEQQHIPEDEHLHILEQTWHHVKPTMAVASGGIHPGLLPKLVKLMGVDIVAQAGGGVHGHPQGTRMGARAMREAAEAAATGISLRRYSKTHPALQAAIVRWGIG